MSFIKSLAAAVSLACCASSTFASQEYSFILVDAFVTDYGLRECYIFDLNNDNAACGTATIELQWPGGTMITYSGFVWTPEDEKTPAPISWPKGINSSLTLAGVSQLYSFTSGQTTTMPLLPSTYMPLVLTGVNDAGTAVGYVQICNCSNSQGMLQIPYLWDPEIGPRTLSVPGATGAWKVNNQGKVIGWIGGNSSPNSYLYDLNTETYMLMSSVFSGANTKTTADDINDLGLVVGSRMSSNGQQTYGYTWSQATGTILLPLPPAGYQPYVKPTSINDQGEIVGSIYVNGSSRAFVYDAESGIRDLNTLTVPVLGFTMMTATAINNNGWIAGYGYGGGGMYRSFVLKPILAADLNGDGAVNAADLALLLGQWGTAGSAGSGNGDLDGDGLVGGADLAALLGAWTS
jgi:hypothetical protein